MPAALRLVDDDQVAVALRPLASGTDVQGVATVDEVPAGHKVAVVPIAVGEPVRKGGHVIGWAARPLAAGAHVHAEELLDRGEAPRAAHRPRPEPAPFQPARTPPESATFAGYRRADGRVGTRNHLLVVPTVNCAATVARAVATRAAASLPPGVDGVTALVHGGGCGTPADGAPLALLRRTLGGYARSPNTAGVLLIGLGCEVNQLDGLLADAGLDPGPGVEVLGIQELGGTSAAVAAGTEALARLAAHAARAERTGAPLGELVVGLQCGGSDGFSALTANPALGVAADLLVAAGGTVLLSETPELSGAIDSLCARAVDDGVAERLRQLVARWERSADDHGTSLGANPSPGNLAGGISTIVEKSVGAAAKGGRSPVVEVVEYAVAPSRRGLVVMDSPGYDPVSVTGQVAAGATLICFTTGRGSCSGSKPAPTLKLSTTSELAARMPDDIDVDCGDVLEGVPLEDVGRRVLDALVATASGRPTASERLGYGDDEFVPWSEGITL